MLKNLNIKIPETVSFQDKQCLNSISYANSMRKFAYLLLTGLDDNILQFMLICKKTGAQSYQEIPEKVTENDGI